MSTNQNLLNVTGADNVHSQGAPPPVIPSAQQQVPLAQEDAGKTDARTTEQKPKLKLFTLNDVKRVVEVPVKWDSMYPGYEPWGFKFRLALSKEVEKARQTFLGLPEDEANNKETYRTLILDQICDLLVDVPTGFGDMQSDGRSAGDTLKAYLEGIVDPDQKETVWRILITANNGYWTRCSPQSFPG
jgi:hypothetical protein